MSRSHKPRRKRTRREEPGFVKGRHAVEALVRHTPRRILTLHHWGGDRGQQEVLHSAQQAGVKLRAGAPNDRLRDDHLAQGLAAHVGPFSYSELSRLAPANAEERLLLVLETSRANCRLSPNGYGIST